MESAADGRQRVLGGLLLLIGALTVFALIDVLWTVFFAITVAYVLAPVKRWIRRRGIGPVISTLTVTCGAAVAVVVLFAPIGLVLFSRLEDAFVLLSDLPETLELQVAEQNVEIVLVDYIELAEQWLRDTAIGLSRALPVLLVKFALFVFVVFGLLLNEDDVGESAFALVPPRYRDIAEALHHRARDTLFAIYVLQGATAFGTALVALPVFYIFGYESWIALATIAGILQFVPVLGPSLLIGILALVEVIAGGGFVSTAVFVVVGVIAIGALPDLLIRPWLAEMTTELSSVLYFIGFMGGLLSMGAIGVIVGPLLIAVLLELAEMVAGGFDDAAGAGAGE